MDEMRAIVRLCRSGLCSVPVRPTAMCCFLLLQLLALELLKVLLENSGPTFRSNERFTAGEHRQGGALVGTDCCVWRRQAAFLAGLAPRIHVLQQLQA